MPALLSELYESTDSSTRKGALLVIKAIAERNRSRKDDDDNEVAMDTECVDEDDEEYDVDGFEKKAASLVEDCRHLISATISRSGDWHRHHHQ